MSFPYARQLEKTVMAGKDSRRNANHVAVSYTHLDVYKRQALAVVR
ncbi:hypothetical protein [Erwinia amylovora]